MRGNCTELNKADVWLHGVQEAETCVSVFRLSFIYKYCFLQTRMPCGKHFVSVLEKLGGEG